MPKRSQVVRSEPAVATKLIWRTFELNSYVSHRLCRKRSEPIVPLMPFARSWHSLAPQTHSHQRQTMDPLWLSLIAIVVVIVCVLVGEASSVSGP